MKKAVMESLILRLQEQLQTMTADRDAEKSMKATARMQRDKMTVVAMESYDLLKRIPGLSSHPLWLEVQAHLIKYKNCEKV